MRRIAVGIGNDIHLNELYEIAGNYEDVIRVQSYSGLIDKLESIMKLACEDQVLGKHNQLVVAIDKKRDAFRNTFQWTTIIINNVVNLKLLTFITTLARIHD